MTQPSDTRRTVSDDDLRAARAMINDMDLQPFDPNAPGTFRGMGESLKSLLRPSAGAGRTMLMAGAPVAIGLDLLRQAARDTGDAVGLLQRGGQPFGAMGMTFPDAPPVRDAQDAYFRDVVDGLGSNAVDAWTPDPVVMGSTARTLSTLNTVIGSVPQLLGTPGLFVASSGVDPAVDLVRQGVDPGTAGTVGGINLAANAAGMRIPAAWGSSLVTRLVTGTGSNVTIGAATDAASATTLRAAGYNEQAEGFDVFNAQVRGLDALMGAAFGVRAHIDAPRLSPTQRDALLVAANADNLQRTSMPGEPAAPGADVRHQDALSKAIDGLLKGERVDVSGVLRAEDFTLRPELRQAVGVQLRGGAKPADVQADFEAIGAKHGFLTTSTTRSKAENDRVGGVADSQHLEQRGTARDWSVKGKTQAQIDAFAADLRAAGFEVITEPHGTGPHVHAELPKGGRARIERAAEAMASRATDGMSQSTPTPGVPEPRPTIEALRTAAEVFPEPPPRATVDEFAAWMTGRQRSEALDQGGATLSGGREFDPMSEAVQMAHARWQAQQEGRSVVPADGETVAVPTMKGDQLVRRMAKWVDGVPVAQFGMRFGALEDTGFGYFVAAPRRHASREAVAREMAGQRPVAREGGARRQAEAAPLRAARANAASGPVAARSPLEAAAYAPAASRATAAPGAAGRPPDAARAALPMEQVAAARAALSAQPDLRVPTGEIDADGNPVTVTAGELLARAEQDLQRARLDGAALTAAAGCFLRAGA